MLALTPATIAALRAQWARLQAERLRLGADWKEHGLIFPSEVGTPISPRNLLKHWYGVQTRCGLIETKPPPEKPAGRPGPQATQPVRVGPWIPFHALRHTALTHLAQHAPIHIVKAIAGHAANQVTFVYLHVGAEEQRAAFVAVEAAYANAA